jgi:hypothetical protein
MIGVNAELRINISEISPASITNISQVVSWGLFFDSEDGDDTFLRHVGWISTDYYTA